MQDNPVKQRLADGGTAFGAMVFEFFSPGLPQLVKLAGADFVLYDMEHTALELDAVKQQIAFCRGLGLPPYVRVPVTDYHFIAHALDAGAMGIMVPMVETREQAEFVVACTRYPPTGRRGAAFGFAHDDYEGGDVRATMAAANARNLVMAQIETERGAANVDAIAAVPGVDVLFLGHFDLTNFLGIPGEFTHPRYLAAIDAIVAAANRHGKTAGMLATDVAWGRDYLARGFRQIAYGADHQLYRKALADGIAALRESPR
jgi:2-dehydro-3-deoxyglucarate aldolase/4-hydroxy-2-oxoheptanedioate aldolase